MTVFGERESLHSKRHTVKSSDKGQAIKTQQSNSTYRKEVPIQSKLRFCVSQALGS